MVDLQAHLIRQMVFSKATYGPGHRTKGVINHIEKEIEEIKESISFPNPGNLPALEWVDMVILSFDGLTRHIWANSNYQMRADEVATLAINMIVSKQGKNELRDWPDWRTVDPNKAIEHVRGKND